MRPLLTRDIRVLIQVVSFDFLTQARQYFLYDKLSKEQFVSLIETLKLSKYLKAPSTGEGKQNRKCRTASEKETQIRKPRHLLNAGVGVLFPCNALEFLA